MHKKKDVLVLFSYRNHKKGYIEMLFRELSVAAEKQGGLSLSRGSLSDMHISITNNELHIVESLTGRPIDSFDLVYFELWRKAKQQALAAATLLNRHSVPFFSEEMTRHMPETKVGELALLADNNVPLPDTFISSNREIKKVFKKNAPFAYPFVLKAADGYGGKSNFLIKDYEHLLEVLSENNHLQFVAQECIPNDCDYRCLVFGGEIKLVLKRTRGSDDTHLNNTSAGALGEIVPLSELSNEAQVAVLAAAKAVHRTDFAGVDLMLHKVTGAPYILEVNQTPQIEIGAEVDRKMEVLLAYMRERAL